MIPYVLIMLTGCKYDMKKTILIKMVHVLCLCVKHSMIVCSDVCVCVCVCV